VEYSQDSNGVRQHIIKDKVVAYDEPASMLAELWLALTDLRTLQLRINAVIEAVDESVRRNPIVDGDVLPNCDLIFDRLQRADETKHLVMLSIHAVAWPQPLFPRQ
jgi:hypothetical protein